MASKHSGISADDPEVKRELSVNVMTVEKTQNATIQLLTYFSDWRRLKKSVDWILKVRSALQEMSRKRKQLTQEDANISEVKQK